METKGMEKKIERKKRESRKNFFSLTIIIEMPFLMT